MTQTLKSHMPQLTLIDHEVRYTPAAQACREHMRKGTIGQLKNIYVRQALSWACMWGSGPKS